MNIAGEAAKAGLMSVRQEEFIFAQDSRINILTGSVRSGKTWASLLKWALFVASMPEGTDFLMAGNTAGTLERNCLSLLSDIVGDRNFSWNRQSMRGELFGRRIWVMGAGDAACEGKLRGMTLGGAYLDELTLLRKDFFMTLLSRLSLPGAKLYATTNPDGPNHWVMADVIKNEKMGAVVWEFKLDDNVFLPSEYVKAIREEYAGGHSGDAFYDRYVLGLWTVCEGAVYKRFAEERTAFLTEDVGRFENISVGVDFGGNRSAHAFVACGMRKRGGDLREKASLYALASRRVLDETMDPDGLFEEIIGFIKHVCESYGSNSGYTVVNVFCDSAEPVLIRGLRRAVDSSLRAFGTGVDVRVRASRKRKILDRIRATITLMARRRFFYTADCRTLESAFASAVWKCDGERLDDGSTDIDTLDAFEYAWERDIERLL